MLSLVGVRPLLRCLQPAVSGEFQQWGQVLLKTGCLRKVRPISVGRIADYLWTAGAGSSFLIHVGLGVVGLAGRESLRFWPQHQAWR